MNGKTNPLGGGEFLLGQAKEAFAPEQFTEQHRLIAATAESFAQGEVAPAVEAIEAGDFPTLRALLRRAGELGLTAVDVPEAYGGLGMDPTTSAIVADHLAVNGSFSVAFGAHAGIATLPLVAFGSEDQRQRYLPKLATAEWVGAYALSEAGSGSDALGLRTTATPASDGSHYILNGEKMWISNAGIADLFTVFAKVGDKVTAFLIEAGTAGLSTGAEEHKMGLHGSSTRALLLREVAVPMRNRLGEVGDGAHIAFQILNTGRCKLGAACIGGARNLLRPTVAYARERHAFGKPLADFGMVRQMLAGMAVGLFASEAMVYRAVPAMDAVNCSIVKVDASEMLDRACDAAVQIHGGNGFVRGNAAERAYRDSRVNRIFEGTNEINRLLIPGVLLRGARQGILPLPAAIDEMRAELLRPAQAMAASEQTRKLTLLLAGLAFQRFGEKIAQQEEVLGAIADLAIATYRLQAVELRSGQAGVPERFGLMARICADETLEQAESCGRRALSAISQGDELRTQLAWLRRLLKREPLDVLGLRNELAAELVAGG